MDSVLAFMGEPPAGPAFLREVEAFLEVTGIKRSLLGQGATGNPSFVAQLRNGVSPSQGVSYYERDGYYAKDDPDHRAASAWAGKGAEVLGLSGPVDPDVFTAILEGRVPDGPQLGRPGKDGEIVHRPGRDLTLSAPQSVSLAALVGGDARVAEAHGRAVKRTLSWVEERVVETRMKDPDGGRIIRAADQKAVIATLPTRPRAISTHSSTPTR